MRAIPHMVILAELTSDVVMDTAYDWLCRRRRAYPADADVWSLRRSWAEEKERIRTELIAGQYWFALLTRITLADGEEIDLWSARDALVLKALAIVLAKHLPISTRSTHDLQAVRLCDQQRRVDRAKCFLDCNNGLAQRVVRLCLGPVAPKQRRQGLPGDALIRMQGQIGQQCACLALRQDDRLARPGSSVEAS